MAQLGSFLVESLNWNHSAAKNSDTSAYNAGSVGWDVKVFVDDNFGGVNYCLKPGRDWSNLVTIGALHNNGQSNDLTQNICT